MLVTVDRQLILCIVNELLENSKGIANHDAFYW